jgi:hypothetical protein
VKVSGCLSSNCRLLLDRVELALATISWSIQFNGERDLLKRPLPASAWLCWVESENTCLLLWKKGLTAQSLCHQGSIAINCSEPELSQVSQPYHIWIHIGLNLYNDIHQLCLIWRDLPEVSLETLIIW